MLWVQFYDDPDPWAEVRDLDVVSLPRLPLVVDDGGPWYFTLHYSVERDSVEYVWFNGPG
jgi:hypothetical protein